MDTIIGTVCLFDFSASSARIMCDISSAEVQVDDSAHLRPGDGVLVCADHSVAVPLHVLSQPTPAQHHGLASGYSELYDLGLL